MAELAVVGLLVVGSLALRKIRRLSPASHVGSPRSGRLLMLWTLLVAVFAAIWVVAQSQLTR